MAGEGGKKGGKSTMKIWQRRDRQTDRDEQESVLLDVQRGRGCMWVLASTDRTVGGWKGAAAGN